ncbi:quinol dehydrogenase ferredoxin subunit NapH [Inhella crocodyli]|uniref:Quinol dehydrogenase ferredoxin subunit NapH n=1 Tax=Inhella crocodyli TaxID=2499851 RepID=A0A437LU02_9BURK|nr:quinol dehydrogenase ferredoxin subunit NapH [Inhella crocodyli]RVT88733.1 quinol dehydrogenase ferredoxin subunit NapH [Inhella crocodyli]
MIPIALAPASPPERSAWRRHRFLLLRRSSQLAVLALFLLGPWAGLWWVKGNLASSLSFGVLPLTDPFVLAQSLAAQHWAEATALIGAALVLAFYGLLVGRAYCGWVCPVNAVTDAAGWLRRRFKLNAGSAPPRGLRYALLAAVLLAAAITGLPVWESVNPVTLTQRALIFGGSVAWAAVVAVFLFDLAVAPRGWCGHVCPMGAAYSLIGSKPLLRVSAAHRSRCNDCGDCYAVCPEPQILVAPLKGKAGSGPLIQARECSACGRCVDVCSTEVFQFTHRFDHRRD